MTLKRGDAVVNMLKSRSRQTERSSDSTWNELNRRIYEHRVIPIISNSVWMDAIFSDLLAQAGSIQEADARSPFPFRKNSENLLSEAWAEEISYPLPDMHELARVAQYFRSRCNDNEEAKAGYLSFLKETLLAYAENLGIGSGLVEELYSRINESSFADLVHDLEFPRLAEGSPNVLAILASLPLPFYVTTSYHDFLERALVAQGKLPTSLSCDWQSDLRMVNEAETSLNPTPECPLVYHLYGDEDHPQNMVLSEQDYLDFLVKVSQSIDMKPPLIPFKLNSALSVSSLLLLGYRVQDWDFRVLFRGIVNARDSNSRGFGLVLQLAPEEQFQVENVQEARKYMEKYFQPTQFNVSWGSVDNFARQLWDEWNKWRQGQ